MFFKNKRQADTRETFLDRKINDINNDRLLAWARLTNRVNDVIVCKGVVELYPEGADKDKAIRDLSEAKNRMLCAIGLYDGLRAELYRALEEPYERISTKHFNTTTKTSHEIIEETYKKFFKNT